MIEAIRQRLEDRTINATSIEIAEDLDAFVAGTKMPSGTVFVAPFRERAKPNMIMTGGFRQVVAVQYVIAFLIREHGDARGSERAKAFDGYKADIEQALAGWEPTENSEPFELVGGESTALGNGVSIYAQTWETTRFLTGD